MTDFCTINWYAQFEDMDKKVKDQFLEEINILRKLHLGNDELYNQEVKRIVNEYKAYKVAKTEMDIHNLIISQNLIDHVSNKKFGGDLKKAFKSLIMLESSNVENTGLNFETLRKVLSDRYINTFKDVLSKQNIFEAVKTGEYDKEVFIAISNLETDPSSIEKITHSTTRIFAENLKHFQDMIHAAYNGAHVPIAYRKGFVVNRVLSKEKVSAVSFSEFSAHLLSGLNLKETYKDIPIAHSKEVMDTLVNGKEIDSLLGGKGSNKNLLAEKLWEIYNRQNSDFDPFTQEEESWFLKESTKPKASTSEIRTRGRKLIFNSPSAEYDFYKKFSPYDTLVEAYGGGAKRAAKEIAMFKTFGPRPSEAINNIISYAKETLPLGEHVDFENDVKAYVHLATYGTSRPTKVYSKALHNIILPLQAAHSLGRAIFANLQDPFVQYIHHTIKGQDGVIMSALKVAQNRLTAVRDAYGEDAVKYLLTAEEERLNVFQSLLSDPSSIPSKIASGINTIGVTKMFNKQTWVSSFKSGLQILRDSASSNNISELQTTLYKKYGLDHDDLKFLSPYLQEMESPRELSMLPSSVFENNPRGVSAKAYQESMATKIHAFMYEYITRSSSTPGVSELIDRNGKSSSADSILSMIGNMGLQFRSVSLKAFRENLNLIGLATKHEKGSAMLRDPKTYKYAAFIASTNLVGYAIYESMHRLFNGETPDEIYDSYKDAPAEKIAELLLKSNTLGFFGDFIGRANSTRDITSSIATPAVEATMLRPGMAAKQLLSGEPKKAAVEMGKAAATMIPGTNIVWLGPLATDIKEFQKNIFENLAD